MTSISGNSPLQPNPLLASKAGNAGNATSIASASPSGSTVKSSAAPAAAPNQLDTGTVTKLLEVMMSLVSVLTGGQGAQAGSAGTGAPAGSPVSFAGSSPLGQGAGACPNCTGPGCASCNASGPTSGPGITTPLPGASAAPAAAVAQMPGVNDQNLQNNLNALAQDPEGAKLLEKAKANGFSVKVGNTGGNNVLGVTDPNTKTIILGDGNNLKTLVHELVHASTTNDGNSQTEEGLANIIGKRVESRLTGKPLENPNTTFNNTLPNYKNLNANNNIVQSLSALGITA